MSNEIQIGEVELTILGDKDVKVVVASIGDHVAIGTARRDPADKPNDLIGESLAAGRAVRQLGRRMLSTANKAIRQEAYAAERQREAQQITRLNHSTVIDGPPAPPSDQLVKAQNLLTGGIDPEIERLLAEEEAIERSVLAAHEQPNQADDDLPVQGFADLSAFINFIDNLGERSGD